MYWYDADSQSAALPEQEKPKGPTDADVRRLADEIKSLKRPPTMMEVRTIAHKFLHSAEIRPSFPQFSVDTPGWSSLIP